jgi:oxygen-independent coproporphyrinogen-3 oxidase
MLSAIRKEIIDRENELSEPVETIYFGGGTPSLLTSSEFKGILETIYGAYEVVPSAEITIEANPDDITSAELIRDWIELGINRLSLGVQSFNENDLRWMNRAHSVDQALLALETISDSDLKNVTMDLIYGLPDSNLNEWEAQIDRFLSFNIPHLSAYCLTVEQRTSLNKWVQEKRISLPDDEMQAKQFELLVEKLERSGFEQYEISNFAKPGFRSRHNTAYWEGSSYLGIGPSAHSFTGDQRRWNVSNNTIYIKEIAEGGVYWDSERLNAKDRFNELLMTGLRRIEGVRLIDLIRISPLPGDFDSIIGSFIEQGWLTRDEGSIRLTRQGRLRADHIASSLFMV